MKNRPDEALSVLTLVAGPTQAKIELTAIANSLSNSPSNHTGSDSLGIATLFSPTLHKVLFVGMVVAILQQITGINSVFFYAPMIFEQTGIGTDASFLQAVLVGLTNLFFTILAMLFIDKVGRRPLLLAGVSGIVVCMLMLAYGFDTARYTLPVNALSEFSEKADTLASVAGQTFRSDVAFREAISNSAGAAWYTANEARLIQISVSLNRLSYLVWNFGFCRKFCSIAWPGNVGTLLRVIPESHSRTSDLCCWLSQFGGEFSRSTSFPLGAGNDRHSWNVFHLWVFCSGRAFICR